MSRRKANGAADEADRIVAERKISSCPDVIVTWLTKNPPDLARAGMETGPLAVWRWTSRQRSADRLHGRPARQCDPGGIFFWTKDKVRMASWAPLIYAYQVSIYPPAFERRCCERAMNSPTKRPNKPNGIQDIRVHAFHTHGANARLKRGSRWLANQISHPPSGRRFLKA
jgi:hypothetical protein